MQFSFCFLPSIFIYSVKFTFLLLPLLGGKRFCERERSDIFSFILCIQAKGNSDNFAIQVLWCWLSSSPSLSPSLSSSLGCDIFCLHHTTPQCSYKTLPSLIFHQLIYRVFVCDGDEWSWLYSVIDEMTQTNTRIYVTPNDWIIIDGFEHICMNNTCA